MNILNFLLESTDESFVKKYEPLYVDVSPKLKDSVKLSLEKLETAVNQKHIWNVDFDEIKNDLKRAMHDSLTKHLKISRSDSDNSPHLLVYYADISEYAQLNQAASQVKKIDSVLLAHEKDFQKSDIEALKNVRLINELCSDLNVILTKLKPYIEKGRKPSDKAVDPNKFVQKLGSANSQKLVIDSLQKGIKKPLDEYENSVKTWLKTIYDKIKSDLSEFICDDPIELLIFSKCFNGKRDYKHPVKSEQRFTDITINKSMENFPVEEAKLQRELIEKQYLAKNVKKLSHIIDLKGLQVDITDLPYKEPTVKSGAGTIESGFKFKFSDNSSFEVVNKIIVKTSTRGKEFNQFPTTFHNVVLADGSKMKQPSEEKMVKEFTKVVK